MTGTTNGAPATRQALRFFGRSMSNGYTFPNQKAGGKIRRHPKTMSNLCQMQMYSAKEEKKVWNIWDIMAVDGR